MAGLVLLAICAAFVAAGAALALSLPFWMALVAYALAGTGTLLLCAGLISLRADRRPAPRALARAPLRTGR